MRIDEIKIDGFGTISDLQLHRIEPGINVLHGGNGSGKTTIVQFLRGMFTGFGDARKLRLLPPLKGGSAGGSLGVHSAAGRFEIIRQGRADHSDTLAIQLLRGSEEDAAQLRESLRGLSPSLLNSVFIVTGQEAHDLPMMLRTALSEGICLTSTRRSEDGLQSRMERIEQERSDLFQGPPARGSLTDLEARKLQLERELTTTRHVQASQLEKWRTAVQQLEQRIAQLEIESDWTHTELQAVQADLTEVQSRLWSSVISTVQESETIARPTTAEPAGWSMEIEKIDREIAHAQQVLRDLAGSRMTLSLTQASLAGAETPDAGLSFQRQRTALAALERQTEILNEQSRVAAAAGSCQCATLQSQVAAALADLREQIWTICDELGRQQSSHEQWLCLGQRDGVDRCELELTRQIQRLRLRRDALLRDRTRTTAERQQFRDLHASQHCECAGHDEYLADLPEPLIHRRHGAQVIARERMVVTSAARPGDAELEITLITRRNQLWSQWQHMLQQQRNSAAELELLMADRGRLTTDDAVQTLRYEYACVEQQLADGREQWQSLALLQQVLQRTRQKLEVETAAPVVEDASQMLRRMTEGRYLKFVFDPREVELRIVNATGAELTLPALSRGTLEQAALCFRLALCREFARRGVSLPLVLDDVLCDSDESRLRAAVEVLLEFAQDHQTIVFTCQDHLMQEIERRGVEIQNLPGSRRSPSAPHFVERSRPVQPQIAASMGDATLPLDRVQPEDPYWLNAQSPLNYVPSLGEQMARRMGALGVRTAGDLIDLDPETTEIPLSGLQISSTTLRSWQAEARLLCCVPGLTGRDAQVLVHCGIQTPAELAEADIAVLCSRIATLRESQSGEHVLPWLATRPDWPSRDAVQSWVRSGRGARRWRRARDLSTERRPRLRHSSPARTTTVRDHATLVVRAPELEARRQESRHGATSEQSRTYWLALDSDIVDAPSIGPRTADRFYRVGVRTVAQFLQQDCEALALSLQQRSMPAETLREWQQQADLMCRVPELRGHDAQILVACGLHTPEAISGMTPQQLLSLVEPFALSKVGQRLIRSAKVPDLAEVTQWIDCARHAQSSRAA